MFGDAEAIRALLHKARIENFLEGAVSLDTEAALVERGYMLSSLSRDLQPSRSI